MDLVETKHSKLMLGTVQFGLNYGINNSNGIPNDDVFEDILNSAAKSTIKLLDSAPSYGNAEERIGKYNLGRFGIVSKFSNVFHQKELIKLLQTTLDNLNTHQLYGYISHNTDELIANPVIWDWLKQEKEKSKIKKIGFSLYSVNQLELLLEKQMVPDIIQFPYNILDRRFKPYLSELVNVGVEIHTRSVYLQGFLQMNPTQVPRNLMPLTPYLKKVREIALKNNLTIGQLCLGFATNNTLINKVVIGVENITQLTENIDLCGNTTLTNDVINEILSIEVNDKNLLNPVNWN
jgi:aryl-alcohol dehydrogenase-like predicted oxidoreductase